MIIDIHTHIQREEHWESFDRHCRVNGISIAVISCLQAGAEAVPHYPHYPEADAVSRANDEALRFVQRDPARLRWLAYINPQLDGAAAEAERCLARGAIGIKMWVALKDPETGSMERCAPVLDLAAQRRLPVLIHTYQRTGPNHPGEVTVPEFARLARAHPGARMIAAHAGGNWRHMLGVLREVPDTVIDVCGGYPEQGMVERLVADLGAGRVLYGSDALGRSFASQIAKVEMSALSPTEKEQVFWRNSARVLGLSEEEVAAGQQALETLPGTPPLDMPPLEEDHFCFCGAWPFREGPHPTPADVETLCGQHGFQRAYCADAAAVYAYNLLDANRAYARAASGLRRVAPLAALAPYPPNWDVVLQEARESFQGGILYPSLQHWRLDDPAWKPFFAACAQASFPLWINMAIADRRFMHRGVAWRAAAEDEVLAFIEQAPPENRYVFQGASRDMIAAALERFPEAAHVRFDLSRLTDNSQALPAVVERFGWKALVLGTEFPWRDPRTVRYTLGKLCNR